MKRSVFSRSPLSFRGLSSMGIDQAHCGILREGRHAKRTFPWPVQLLLFVAVYLVINVIMSVVMIIPLAAILFTNPDLLQQIMEGDATGAAQALTSNASTTLLSLLITAVEIAVPVLFCRFVEGRSLGSMGFTRRRAIRRYLAGYVLGAGLLGLTALLAVAGGAIRLSVSSLSGAGLAWLAAFFVGFLIQGMAEEVFLRGYFLCSLAASRSAGDAARGRMPLGAAIAVSSAAFSFLHLMNDHVTVLALVNIALFGLCMAVYFLLTDSIWGVAALHSAWNFFQGNIFGVQVSGMTMPGSLLTATQTGQNTLIGGGDFGLEGGLATTAVLLLFLLGLAAVGVARARKQ